MPSCASTQLNDVLSLGLHRVWKRAAVKWSGASRGQTALDVCCGSGDLAMRLAQAVGIDGKVKLSMDAFTPWIERRASKRPDIACSHEGRVVLR